MEYRRWLALAIFIGVFTFSAGREVKINHEKTNDISLYNHTLATILVEYASAVYVSDLTELFTWTCSRCDGLTKGFEVIELIVDVQHCLQSYVGVAEDLNAIIIAFRGTQEHSIQNWVEDLYWKQLDLNYPGMPDAMVHHGFYYAYHNTTIRPAILNAVKRAKEIFGDDLSIMVTGHSMGGAMASFCGLDLTVNHEAQNVQVMTFGQPRIGNAVFASYYNDLVPNTIRVTNGHDIVPHLPPYYSYFSQKTYHHFPREVWLYDVGLGPLVYEVEKVCDDSGEDPSCSRQVFPRNAPFAEFIFPYDMSNQVISNISNIQPRFPEIDRGIRCRSVSGNSISDHLVYFGVELMCHTWGSCRIVMDSRVREYGTADLKGNIVLSKTWTTPDLKLADSGNESKIQ